MKKFCFIFILAELAIGNIAYAQTPQQAVSSGCSCSIALKSVHMSTQGNEIISCRAVGNFSEFIKFNTSLAGRIATIQNINVSDFDVLDGKVYFCGEDYLSGSTLFGYFNESDFNSQYFQATCFKLQLDFVSKIRVYFDDATQSVGVAIVGGLYDDYDPNAYIVLRSDLIVGHTNGTYFDYYDYDSPTVNGSLFNYNIHYYDIVITDDYIVSVGMNTKNTQDIILSRINKTNLGVCDQQTIIDPANLAVNTAPIVEKLEGNDVALTSLYSDVVNNINYARVYRYDMSNFINTGIQDVAIQEKGTLDDLLYIPDDQSLLILSSTEMSPVSSNLCSSIYYVYPYATAPYTTDYMYDEDARWYSMERALVSHFVVGGEKLYNEWLFFIQDKQAGAVSQCHHFTTTNVLIQNTLTGKTETKTRTLTIVANHHENCTSDDFLLVVDCP